MCGVSASRGAAASRLSFSVRKKKFVYYLANHHGDGIVAVSGAEADGEAIDADIVMPVRIAGRDRVPRGVAHGDIHPLDELHPAQPDEDFVISAINQRFPPQRSDDVFNDFEVLFLKPE